MKKNLIVGLFGILAMAVSFEAEAQEKKKPAKADPGPSDKDGHTHEKEKGHAHPETAPHGGTVVKLGKHAFNLEFVRDPDAGKFQVYVLDGHMEYVAVSEMSFDLVAKINGREEKVTLTRAPAPGADKAGEKSSLFEGQAEWIKSARKFQGTIPEIKLNGQSFAKVSFAFPQGSAKAHAH